ncbi:MAG TPA: hypothetical protein EYP32_05990, partial [Aquificaceae bacterium]|nr:hypothetical protein [Aquificaceae bacterium]
LSSLKALLNLSIPRIPTPKGVKVYKYSVSDLKLEILADLGYDFVIVDKGPKVETLDDIEKLEDYESLKSLIRKIKATKGAEKCGAIGIFIGYVKKISHGKEVVRLEYERFDELYWKKR